MTTYGFSVIEMVGEAGHQGEILREGSGLSAVQLRQLLHTVADSADALLLDTADRQFEINVVQEGNERPA